MNVTKATYEQVVKDIMECAAIKESSYVCVANVHMLLETYYSRDFRQIVNNANIVTPDGMPIAKSFKMLYGVQQQRIDGMSLLPRLLAESTKAGTSVYFYGGSQKMLDITANFLKDKYPALRVAGMYSPPFRELNADEKLEIAKNINDSGANMVFVVLGCPKQETWMSQMKGKISAVMIGVGGALPVLVGLQERAPKWMQDNSLEWSFRLMQEPNRLFKRYFKTNSHFLFLLTREKLKKKFKF
ncbi:WecB/TagA/CpsF family glycosyltransferase [Pedobacter duraquae]|nr:WecB/TagA/CpsF family glycosyltransferase [Pedobacter duraquae]